MLPRDSQRIRPTIFLESEFTIYILDLWSAMFLGSTIFNRESLGPFGFKMLAQFPGSNLLPKYVKIIEIIFQWMGKP